ncbi:MAG: sulfatase-like hydrolase/transferase, partial [Chloroflexota bacterium]|nr:sulfatase-like hydrolase/transferase [Chloroflexota bacterium]
LGVFAFRVVTRLFIYLAAASVILTGVFAFQIATRSTAQDWSSPDTPPLAQGEVQKDPIFIVIFDALGGGVLLKDGQIDAERFPHFAALGRDSAVFTNATSNYNLTHLSIPSFLTGRWVAPEDLLRGRAPSATGAHADSVLSVLRQNGYSIKGYDEGLQLLRSHPELMIWEVSIFYYETMVPRLVRDRFYLSALSHPFTLLAWDDFLREISASRSPGSVYLVHPMVPHEPFEFDRYGQKRPSPPSRDASQMERAYEEQVRLVDNLLGKFTDKLKAEGLYERSVIVVTGDHGPRPVGALLSRPPQELHAFSPSVTMIIHAPRVRPRVSEVDYQHIDFRPTLWEALGWRPTEKGLSGVSAFAPDRPRRDKWFWNDWTAGSGGSGVLEIGERLTPFSGGWFKYDRTTGWWRLSPSGPP